MRWSVGPAALGRSVVLGLIWTVLVVASLAGGDQPEAAAASAHAAPQTVQVLTSTPSYLLTSTLVATMTPTTRLSPRATDVYVPAGQSVLTTTVDLNVRQGPGVEYPVLGYLPAGRSAAVTGVNADRSWLQIVFATAPGGRGWVSRRYVVVGDLTGVPQVSVPVALPTPLPTPTATPTPSATPVPEPAPAEPIITDWQGEYYANLTLSGTPAVVRNDAAIDFNWADRAPAPGLPADDFSVRWTRIASFAESTYRFTVLADDGVRLWIDGNLIIDEWHDTRPTTYAVEVPLTAGPHHVRLEYYEHLGNAVIQLVWYKPDDWKAKYFANRKLQDAPVLERYEDEIDHDWGQASPDPAVPADNFSARWTRQQVFREGTYVFVVEVDDGARLWIDDQLLINSWQDGQRTLTAERYFGEKGEHSLRVEYYEHWGGARIRVTWYRK